ncbi:MULTISPECIES: restriction endonuclease subunit S [unclassified Agrobacterium]|uniref:restriction endonuclease subunit S n=1 Tax=unclassified Agrobacterium TaxID=2632611 RepID=UPI0003612084|nr:MULTISPECIES: restriction endonuclease subunit S [unclassified Agrobacterium]SNB83277.1 type I restriction enzyme, S subunit [Agrobacterium sp. 719_389]
MSWRETTIDELVHIKHGFAFKGDQFNDHGPFVVLTPGNCQNGGGFKDKGEKEKRYSGEVPDGYLLKSGDLMVVMTDLVGNAPVLGGSFIIPEDGKFLHNQRLGLVTLKRDAEASSRFVYYLFNTETYRGQVRGSASGATVRHTSPGRIGACKVHIPDLSTQERIASLLSAYDDLIENNRRRIALLEQAARLLYREWFVHFRFPGHEAVKIVDGLPEGWSIRLLADLCVEGDGIQTGPFGSQLHQSDYTDTGVPVVMPKDMKENKVDCDVIARIPESLADKLGRHRMLLGDTVYGRRGDIGRRAFIGKRQTGFFCGTGCLRIRPDPEKINARYLFETLGSPATSGFIVNQAKGSTMPNLSAGALKKVPVLCAPDALQVQFTDLTEPMLETAEILGEQIIRLIRARDLLLPRLMDGRIPV